MANLLVVDDDQSYRKLLGDLLTAEGFEVATAGNCEEAVAAAMLVPDVLVVDWNLTGDNDGFEVIRKLRNEIGHHVPAIVISGYTSEKLRQTSQTMPAATLLRKPFGTQALIDVVQKLLSDSA